MRALHMMVRTMKQLTEVASAQSASAFEGGTTSGSTPAGAASSGSAASPATDVSSDISEAYNEMESSIQSEYELLRTTQAIAGIAQTIQVMLVGTAPGAPVAANSTPAATDPEFCRKVAQCIGQMARARQIRKGAAAKPRPR